ncbi:AraC family transcriptional regulator [Paenibacillus sp. Soil766]|uniref:AraC family transcriptional regulator n=1 Tax=Paenibacillus sp. Soil766 TaxID=1736404 RepID=UPI00070E1C0B|nr:AraC family transcriptional regulator [Paenibacillus sp. Soil766]KRE98523.1 AraC family transcriptional regulator [Paenibacillus sp. Soil766]
MSRYLLRLLSYSLILGILPAVLIGIVSYTIASGDVEKKVKEMNMQWLTQTQMRVEQMLKSIEKSATQFANSTIVKSSMHVVYSPTDFESVRELSKELYNLQSSDAIITQAYLVNLERSWGLNLNVMKPLDQFENRSEFIDYAKNPKSILWYTGKVLAGANDDTEEPVESITLVHKIPILPQTDKPQGLLAVRIIASEIQEALASSDTSKRSYILDRSGVSILGGDSNNARYAEVNKAVTSRVESDPERKPGLFNTKLGGEEVAVLYRASSYNSWMYVSVVSIGEMKKETQKIAELTLIVCATILIIVLAAALYGSSRMYRPIGNLLEFSRRIGSSGQDQPFSAKRDELEYIKISMQSLAVSRDRVEQQMLGQASHLKEFFVLKLFTGQMTENDYLFRSMTQGFPSDWKKLGVLALQIDNLQETRYSEEDRELLLYAVSNIAQEVLPAASRFPAITFNQSQVTLVATDEEETEEVRRRFYEAAECIKRNAEEVLQLKVSIGISNPFVHLIDTVKAYGECLTALKARISLGPEIIVHYGDIENHPGTDRFEYSHLKVLEERLVYAIREMQPNSASEIFQQYLNALLYKDGSLNEHQTLLLQLVSKLLHIVQDQGISLNKVFEDEGTLAKLLHLQTREAIIHWFESKLFAPLIQTLSEKSEAQYVNIADKLVRIIQEQYDREITLESCAQVLNYHPVYVSRIFKREIGMTFSDYLSDFRMKMAKVMLETTDLKLQEISERLQYKNISSFIRNYKKTYQITPGQYREKIMKGGKE